MEERVLLLSPPETAPPPDSPSPYWSTTWPLVVLLFSAAALVWAAFLRIPPQHLQIHTSCPPSAIDAGRWVPCPPLNATGRYCEMVAENDPRTFLGPWRTPHPAIEDSNAEFVVPGDPADVGCALGVMTPHGARDLLRGKRLLFVGDSTMQELAVELVSFLEESPNERDYFQDAWINQTPCPGLHQAYATRSFTTTHTPSPWLGRANISITMVWNGHASECENLGPLDDQLSTALWDKIRSLDGRPFDHAIYNVGQHAISSNEPRVLSLELLRNLTRVVATVFERLHREVAHTVTWKDSTPSSMYPAVTIANDACRAVASAAGRRWGQPEALDVWPVGEMLGGLGKQDKRHCSYKDVHERDYEHRERNTRSVYCHTAIQLLLHQIQAS
jgi:hypothetical protein